MLGSAAAGGIGARADSSCGNSASLGARFGVDVALILCGIVLALVLGAATLRRRTE
jgi:hypothetical protein